MTKFNHIFLFALVIIITQSSILKAQSCYELVWSDEFNYNGLPDSTVWAFEEGGTGWGNNELQYYTSNRLENARVEDGFLTITAREENYNGREYTSARLITYPTNHSWQYGKIEAKIKLPFGQGIWPAFWALGNGIFEGTPWPGCGEIDIMEMIGGGEGRDDVVHGTIHYADTDGNHAYYGGDYQLDQGIFADNFHTFSIEWTPTEIKWYMDDIHYHTASLTNDYLSELHEEFFLLLNIAVGGNWPGNPNSSTQFPQEMVVDYVRVYQLDTEPEITGKSIVHKAQKNIEFKTVESEDFTYNWTVPADATIASGQGTHAIKVDWGCNAGIVTCDLATNCDTYTLTFNVDTEDIQISGNELIQTNSENNTFSIPLLAETTYNWEVPTDASIVGTTYTNTINVTWGSTAGWVKVNATNNCGTERDSLFVEIVNQLPYPDPDTKHPIPGTVEAINYDYGGEGIAYHDTDAVNEGPGSRQDEGVDTETNDGGENIGWIKPGEWVEYTVNVDSTALYDIELRVASLNGGGNMEIHFNGEDRTGEISIPATGSWSSFISLVVEDIQLYNTDTLMRLHFNVGDFNISRTIFNYEGTGITHDTNHSEIRIYPNPAQNELQIRNITGNYQYSIHSVLGNIVQTGTITTNNSLNISKLNHGTYFLMLKSNDNTQVLKFIKK